MSNINEKQIKSLKKDYKEIENVVEKILKENKKLKETNKLQESRINDAKSKIYEVSIIANKLSHINKLLFENTLSKTDQNEIMLSINEAKTSDEVKLIAESLNNKFNSKSTGNSNVNEKLRKQTTYTGNKNVLKEHNAYSKDNSETNRMKDLITFKSKH
jgi:hypothetical protein